MNRLKLINLQNNKSYTITNEINQIGSANDCILELKDNPELEAHHGILKVLFNENTIELTATTNQRIYCKINSDSSTTNDDGDDDNNESGDDDFETRKNFKFIDSNEKTQLKHDDCFGLLPYSLNQLEYWFKIEFTKLPTEEEESPPSQRILPDWLMNLGKTNKEACKLDKTVKLSTTMSTAPSTHSSSSMKNTNKDSTKANIPINKQIESQISKVSTTSTESTTSTVSTTSTLSTVSSMSSSSSSTSKNTNKEITTSNIELDTENENPSDNSLNVATSRTITSLPNITDNDESQGTVEINPDDENLPTTQPLRPSCEYGAQCYRRNPDHKLTMAHPNDADYRSPGQIAAASSSSSSNNTLPICQFGIRCYRRNPVHFQECSHPPSTNLKRNRTLHKIRTVKGQDPNNPGKRARKQINHNSNNGGAVGGGGGGSSDDEDDYDLDDPFINDGSSDEYVPSNDDSSHDDDDDDDDFVINMIEND